MSEIFNSPPNSTKNIFGVTDNRFLDSLLSKLHVLNALTDKHLASLFGIYYLYGIQVVQKVL